MDRVFDPRSDPRQRDVQVKVARGRGALGERLAGPGAEGDGVVPDVAGAGLDDVAGAVEDIGGCCSLDADDGGDHVYAVGGEEEGCYRGGGG